MFGKTAQEDKLHDKSHELQFSSEFDHRIVLTFYELIIGAGYAIFRNCVHIEGC